MKKTLLTLAILLGLSSAAKAENIVEDWTTKSWGPDAQATSVSTATSPSTNIEYTFYNTKTTGGYAFLKGAATNSGYISFSLPINCAEIQLKTTSSGLSTNTGNTITVYAGDVEVVTGYKVNAMNTVYKIAIPAAQRAAGTVYKILANGSKNPQFVSFTYVEPTAEPVLSVADTKVDFATPMNVTQSYIIKGNAENLPENISISVDNPAFALSATSIAAAELANGVEVSFTGKAVGTETGAVTFKSGDLTQTVALSAVTVAHEGTEADPLTVADVIAMDNKNIGPFYVTGTIGDKCAANAVDGVLQEAASVVATNLILKDAEGNMIAVSLPSGETRTKLNILDNPTNVGQTIIVKGTLEAYFGVPGVRNNVEYISGLSSTGIDSIEADVNAPVEYYNLQGIRVNNPENGLYIRRQGNKVTKVIVK